MTALLELKQKIKGIYGQYEMYILPVLKFVLALVYFLWVNSNMGYMSQLNNVFVILILALICFHKLNGVREGTLINALVVGQLVKQWRRCIEKPLSNAIA